MCLKGSGTILIHAEWLLTDIDDPTANFLLYDTLAKTLGWNLLLLLRGENKTFAISMTSLACFSLHYQSEILMNKLELLGAVSVGERNVLESSSLVQCNPCITSRSML